jgi:hypothetical protein
MMGVSQRMGNYQQLTQTKGEHVMLCISVQSAPTPAIRGAGAFYSSASRKQTLESHRAANQHKRIPYRNLQSGGADSLSCDFGASYLPRQNCGWRPE